MRGGVPGVRTVRAGVPAGCDAREAVEGAGVATRTSVEPWVTIGKATWTAIRTNASSACGIRVPSPDSGDAVGGTPGPGARAGFFQSTRGLGRKTCMPSVTRSPPTRNRKEAEGSAAPNTITSTMAYAPGRKRE
jgi:hypothetical protein